MTDLGHTVGDARKRTSDAVISADGLYRYKLGRTWDPAVQRLTFVMLNPSTADAETDDPTIRRCIGFAKRDGWGGIAVVNLYAWRATSPAELWTVADPVGPDNDEWLSRALLAAAEDHTKVVAAWGTNAKPARVAEVLALPHADQFMALSVTKAGHPGHPLYIRGDAQLQPWAGAR